MITRRQFLTATGGLAAGGLGVGFAGVAGARSLQVTRHAIGDAASGSSTRIAVLTDLHLQGVSGFEERIAAEVTALAADVIALVGDTVDSQRGLDELPGFLEMLPPGVPAFATLGNWEHWGGVDLLRLRAVFNAHGVQLLVNEWAELPGGRRLYGVDDYVGGRPQITSPNPGQRALLLSHCPGYLDEGLPQFAGFDGMISGHTHGGQIRIGGWAPIVPPGSGDYVVGKYEGGPMELVVSQGLGTSVLPLRIGATPEVIDLTWFGSSQ